jgi:hypothetical protein
LEEEERTQYLLTGITVDEETRHIFNHENEALTQEQVAHNLCAQRDYDSIIGHIHSSDSTQLPYRTALNVYPVSRALDVMKKDNHMKANVCIVRSL